MPDIDPSSLGDFDDDEEEEDEDEDEDDDEDDEDEDAPGAATTAGLSMDVDDAMFKFIPEEEREAAKAAYLRMAAGGGGGRSAEAGADGDDEDEDGVEVFAEEDIEDDLYLTDEADGLTQATVQQAKGAIVKSVRFMQACVRVKDCPPPKHPEVAVIGRSNVGKSSLVNMLTNRKDIAKTSKNPGKTRTINHFEMIAGDGTWYFVDLPGYGFGQRRGGSAQVGGVHARVPLEPAQLTVRDAADRFHGQAAAAGPRVPRVSRREQHPGHRRVHEG